MELYAKDFTGGNAIGRLKDEVFFQTLNDYLNHHLPVQRCASIHTIKAYRTAIHELLEYILKKRHKIK